jgi:hypothetical protein
MLCKVLSNYTRNAGLCASGFLFRAAGFNSQLEAFMKVEIEMLVCHLIRSMSYRLSCIFCSRNIYDNRHNGVESCVCKLDIQMMNMGIVGLTRRTDCICLNVSSLRTFKTAWRAGCGCKQAVALLSPLFKFQIHQH